MSETLSDRIEDADVALVEGRLAAPPETESVAGFVAGPGIEKLSLAFDIEGFARRSRSASAAPTSWAGCRKRALPPCR